METESSRETSTPHTETESPMIFMAEDMPATSLGRPPDAPPVHPTPRPSFRDITVNGGGPSHPPLAAASGFADLATFSNVGGNKSLPRIDVKKPVLTRLGLPWSEALVVKLLGRSIGYGALRDNLLRIWKPRGSMQVLDVDNGTFLVKFESMDDREKALSSGPWMIYDHYLAVSQWYPGCVKKGTEVTKATVWIRLPGLDVLYYDEVMLKLIASVIGTPVRVDPNTLAISRGRYARVCVEVDLLQPLVGKILLDGEWQLVSYEGLHTICSVCGMYGHKEDSCSENAMR